MEVLVTRISAVFRFGLPCVCLFACMIVCLFVCLFLSLFAVSFSYILSTSSASLQKTCNKLYLPTHGMRTREIHMYVIEQACGPCLGIGGSFLWTSTAARSRDQYCLIRTEQDASITD